LSKEEKSIVCDEYGLKEMTFTPSMFGDSKLDFKTDKDVVVLPDVARYHQTIAKEILDERNKGRAVLVFFDNVTDLNSFTSSEYGQRIHSMLSVVTESTDNIQFSVTKATRKESVTLFPKVFGRGLDFKCSDQDVEAAGGVHVIQTFFSDFVSEEIQIKGRTARQTKRGSYRMLLLVDDLVKEEKGLKVTVAQVMAESAKSTFYDFLCNQRMGATSERVTALKVKAKHANSLHSKSNKFLNVLKNAHPSSSVVVESMVSFGKQVSSGTGASPVHVIFCLDESMSMQGFWGAVVQAYSEFLAIRTDVGGLGGDRVSVVQFSSGARITVDKASLDVAVASTTALAFGGGGTNFVPALKHAQSLVKQSEVSGMDTVIVFMTDGEASDGPQASSQVTHLRNACSHANAKFMFFGLAFSTGGAVGGSLNAMTQAVQGTMVSATNVNELKDKFQFIANQVSANRSR
jgi:hypothetical protein